MFFVLIIVVPCLVIAYHAYLLRVAVRLSGAGDLSIAESVSVTVSGGFFTLVSMLIVSCAGASADPHRNHDFVWTLVLPATGLVVWTVVHICTLNSSRMSLRRRRNPLVLLIYTALSALAVSSLTGGKLLLSLI